ncbi:MAG: carbohydrate ABC transporter permease [Clostridia bacterium]|nr:carbohydrate ABC transporter permease [Clostridia bacterium]
MKVLGTVLNYGFLLVVAFSVLLPFYWMLISSVKSMSEYMRNPPTLFPHDFHFENYLYAFQTANLKRLFLNTIFVGLVSTLLSLVITILSAFAFARLEFKGKNVLFAALLGTMMIPGELFTITNYQTIAMLEWEDTYKVLIIPFLVSVFYIYLLRQNFLQIPNELYLAAKVDGTSDFKYLWKVMIPLAFPTIVSITILKMMGSWNTYVWPNLVISDPNMKLITQGIRDAGFKVDYDPITNQLVQTMDVNIPIQMAAVSIVSLPLFLVFMFFRKYIMKGVSRSGIKG